MKKKELPSDAFFAPAKKIMSESVELDQVAADGKTLTPLDTTEYMLDGSVVGAEYPDTSSHSSINSHDFKNMPNIDLSLQATILKAMTAEQSSIHPVSPTSATERHLGLPRPSWYAIGQTRWILSSLLKHYLGSEYGQCITPSGQVRYATDEKDHQAISAYFDYQKLHTYSDMLGTVLQTTAETSSIVDPAINSEQLATKRDEKLRWLLGEPVNSRLPISDLPLPSAGSGVSTLDITSSEFPSSTSSPGHLYYASSDESLVSPDTLSRVHCPPSTSRSFPSLFNERASSNSSAVRYYHSSFGKVRHGARRASISSNLLHNDRSPPFFQTKARGGINGDSSFDDLASIESGTTSSPRGTTAWSRHDSISTCNSQTRLVGASHVGDARHVSRRRSGSEIVHSFRKDLPKSADSTEVTGRSFRLLAHQNKSPRATSVYLEPFHTGDLTVSASASLPPTTNDLSIEEKRALVKKHKKLRAVLGIHLDEDDPRILHNQVATAYPQHLTTEETDVMTAATDYPNSRNTHKWAAEDDLELLSSGMSRASSSMLGSQ